MEKHVQMASNRGRKGRTMKSLKKEIDEEDDDFLEDLVVDTEEPRKPTTYSNLKPGGFIMKDEDCKVRLDKRHARIAATREQDDDDDDEDDDEGETEKEQLEREARELQSELRKTERAAEKARNQEEKKKHDDSVNAYKVEYS